MRNYSDGGEIALVCSNSSCANVMKMNVSVDVAIDADCDILGFDSKIMCRCPKCKDGIMEEKDILMADIIAKLSKKHYYVLDQNQGNWAPGTLFAPFIKILIGGPMDKLPRPKGWLDITPSSVGSFQMFAPRRSYGCATESEDVSQYSVETVFETEEEFNKARELYLHKLDKWVDQLDLNTTIATKQNLNAGSDVIDID